MKKNNEHLRPDRIVSYFRMETVPLLATAVTGPIYNFGLLAGPWFEGKLAGCLMNILNGTETFHAMLVLAIGYVMTITVVQSARYIKRFYVRRFANNVNRSMKKVLYANLVNMSRAYIEKEGAGDVMTKAISDVDDCAEGMRKFTTEVFDTGIALIGYVGMLLYYDWRVALISLVFPPVSYFIAEKMKFAVQKAGSAYKKSAGRLSAATLDRVSNAVTYRVYGCEDQRTADYEKHLGDYEKTAVRSNIWVASLAPLYRSVCMVSVIPIIYLGARNVLGSGWSAWDIAAFTTFLSCFTKLSDKSSKAAKLFNSVHKAQVSWNRIKPLMKEPDEPAEISPAFPANVVIDDLSFSYTGDGDVFSGLSVSAAPGEIIGVTGPVACGKSTFGKVFLREYPYRGSVRIGGTELRDMTDALVRGTVGYLGHDPELQSDTVENNVRLGDSAPCDGYLRAVCIDREIAEMPDGIGTAVCSGGVRLSGGQAQRLGLARTLYHGRPVLVLDDPFSALDRTTETQVFDWLRDNEKDSVVFLISHRLYMFPKTNRIIWMSGGYTVVGTHSELMKTVPEYAELYNMQKDGNENEKK